MRHLTRTVRLVTSALLVFAMATPGFASPYATPSPIVSEGFEDPASSNYTAVGISGLTYINPAYYWARITDRAHSGAWGMWVAGTTGTFPEYLVGTGGEVDFNLPQLADYYASDLRFYYTMGSRGSADAESLRLSWFRPEDPTADQYTYNFPLTSPGGWSERYYTLSDSPVARLSRSAGKVRFRFIDKQEGFGAYAFTGEGPTIDDVSVSGWKYGPPRELTGTVVGSSVNLDWARPYRAIGTTSTEERPIAYRVWRAPAGTSSWTELTTSRLGDSAVSFSDPVASEGVQQRYSVQAWDVAGETGYGRAAETTVTIPSTPPSVTLSAPSAGFPVTLAPVTITGTASDVGVGVSAAQVRIRRADGLCWNGNVSAWVSADTWINASSANGWATWSYSWQPDSSVMTAGQVVTISARARDKASQLSSIKQVSSAVPVPPSASLAGGATLSAEQTVTAQLNAAGATHVRYSVNGGAYSSWRSFASTIPVGLGSGDGSRTVSFQLSTNGGTTVAYTVADDIMLHTSVPDVAITGPVAGYSLSSGPVLITGTAGDGAGLASSVGVRIRRADGWCWNGSTWVVSDYWIPAITTNGYATWALGWTPDEALELLGQIVTISARATDSYGLQRTTAGVASSVPVAASVSLEDGSAYSTTTTVSASLVATGSPIRMRYRVDSGSFTETMPFSSSTTVDLTSEDGTKTVTFEVSNGETTATATDSIVLHASVPEVAITSPEAGFVLVGTVPLLGVAHDAGMGVESVRLQICRSDGYYYNGIAWVPSESEVEAVLGEDGMSWAYNLNIDPRDVVVGSSVSVTARAYDAFGLSSDSLSVVSASPVAPSLTLEGGAPYTSSQVVAAAVSATGATYMRHSVDGSEVTSWTAFSAETTVGLPASEGAHTVRFEFSDDAVSSFAEAEQDIFLDSTGPSLVATSPQEGFDLSLLPSEIRGSVEDTASGLSSVRVRISHSGMFWNGFGWQDVEYWLDTDIQGTEWVQPWLSDSGVEVAGYDPVAIDVVAKDLAGNTSSVTVGSNDPKEPTRLELGATAITISYGGTAKIVGTLTDAAGNAIVGRPVRLQYYSSGWKYISTILNTDASGTVSYPAKLANKTQYRLYFAEDADYLAHGPSAPIIVTPKILLAAPYAPASARRGVSFATYGLIRPRHSSGYAVRIYRERYVSGKWKSYGYVTLKSAAYGSYSKYSGRVSLPYTGKWRLRAYVPADSYHAATYSNYTRTISVR